MLPYTECNRIRQIGDAMKAEEFQRLADELEKLTPHQRNVLADRLRQIGHAQTVNSLVESREIAKPVCPRCGHEHILHWGTASGLRYRCGACKATFNALTGTPLARLRHKDRWLEYTQQMAEGKSVRKSAIACDVHRNTAFRWRHRFLALPNGQKATSLAGIAEADETFFLESFKGKKLGMPRAPRKRGGKASKRGLSDEQIPVLICRDRAGSTTDFVLDKADKAHIGAALKPILAKDAILCTDSGKALSAAAREMGIAHRPVNLAAGVRVIAGVYHVQNVNAYDSRLKEWMRRFHGVATHYLANYLGWRRLIERAHDTPSPSAVLLAALGINSVQHVTVT
jgi:transposase-like protein